MTANLFFEARSEGQKGMEAVAKVTMNRVKAKGYPPDVCSVVFQKKQFSWTHQQSWSTVWNVLNGDLRLYSARDRATYHLAKRIAQKALDGVMVTSIPDDVLWYHTTKVKPSWSKRLKKLKTVGSHIFYKEK